jgi:c(7)-type cytochrome triheme protein
VNHVSKWLAGAVLVSALVAPPIFAVNAPQDVRIPPVAERSKPAPALFSHWQHGAQACYTCHPSVFPQGLKSFTHQDMHEGRFCADCHDGRKSQAIKSMRCEGCHVPR